MTKWAFLVYMAGNNSLSDAATADLAEMRRVGSTDDVGVLIFVKQEDRNAHRIQLRKGGVNEIHQDLGDVDSGDPQTVVDFVRWAVATAPADRYALVLWNHGGGWAPADLTQLYGTVRAAETPGDTGLREMNGLVQKKLARSLFSTTVKKILSQPTAGERAILSDDGTGHSVDTIELGKVLKATKRATGRPLDLLGMDACLMSELEVAYQSSGEVGIVVGSEAPEPGAGWPYQPVMKALTAKPDMDGAALATVVVRSYVSSYRNARSQWPVTQCAVDTSKLDAFASAMDAFSKALRAELPGNWMAIYTAHTVSVEFDGLRLFDLRSFCRNLQTTSVSDDTKGAAQQVDQALSPSASGYVLAEGHLGPEVEDCGGVTIYLPAPTDSISPYYKDLAFAKKHGWAAFLGEYHDAVKARRT